MKIAHLLLGRCNPDSANGVDKTVYHLARHQAALGAEVAVFSLTTKEPRLRIVCGRYGKNSGAVC